MADLPDPAESVKQTPATLHEPQKFTRSVKHLADTLHVSRPTIYAWQEIPGCPGKSADGSFEIAAWQAFARQIGSKTEAGQSEGKAALQEKELEVVIETRQFNLDVKRGQYTHNSQIAGEVTALVQEAVTTLRAKFERELPALFTTDEAHNRALSKAAIDEVCARLHQPLPCQQEGVDAEDE